jgi:phosphatidylglycerol:prolipoprotein diacylglycerol transferase
LTTPPSKPTPPEDTNRFSVGSIVLIVLGLMLLGYMIYQAVPTWQGTGDPVAFHIGKRGIPWYGIILMSGAMIAAIVTEGETIRRGLDGEHIWNILLWGLLLGVTVSRLWYVLGSPSYYLQDPLRIIGVDNGEFVGLRGLTIHGALFGAILAVVLYTRWQKLYFWLWLDLGAIGFVLGQAIGRWGTSLPWGLRIAQQYRIDAISPLGNFLPEYSKLQPGASICDLGLGCYRNMTLYPFESTRFHPTFLYESLWNLAICLFLIYLSRRLNERLVRGEMFFIYGMFYAVGRFVLEFLRVDSIYLGDYPVGQVVSVALFLLFAGFAAVRRWVVKIPPGPSRELPDGRILSAADGPSGAEGVVEGEPHSVSGPDESPDLEQGTQAEDLFPEGSEEEEPLSS